MECVKDDVWYRLSRLYGEQAAESAKSWWFWRDIVPLPNLGIFKNNKLRDAGHCLF